MHAPAPPPAGQAERVIARWHLLALLITVSAISPLTLNILMPAMPNLTAIMQADYGTVQLLLSLYMIGMAVSQLVLGALSDRFGRRPVLLAGLALAAIASFVAMAATGIVGLIAARLLQAFGASTGLVISRAIVRDLYDRDHAASMIGWMTSAMVVAPMVAPTIGGLLHITIGWHAIFAFVGILSLLAIGWTASVLPETRVKPEGGVGLGPFLAQARALVVDRSFLGYTLVCTLASVTFFSFLGGAPYVVVTQMGRSEFEYGIWFGIGGLGYMLGNFCAARFSPRFGVDHMIMAGGSIALVSGVVGVLMPLFWTHWGPVVIFLPQMLLAVGNGMLLPNAIAGAVSARPQAAGTAAGINGFLQMAVGAAGAQLVSHLLVHATTALPMAVVMFVSLIGAALVFVTMIARKPKDV